jgi:hypothetical protein
MATTLQLSPVPHEDIVQYCEFCEDETLHISVPTQFTHTGEFGYLTECEPCMLSWDWR